CYSLCAMRKVKALDLHVLGTPPAFILSQDQTLHKRQTLHRVILSRAKPAFGCRLCRITASEPARFTHSIKILLAPVLGSSLFCIHMQSLSVSVSLKTQILELTLVCTTQFLMITHEGSVARYFCGPVLVSFLTPF